MQRLFESWSLTDLPIPPRTVLYSIKPMGAGTTLVESLTGYVARLAEEHSVSVGDLVGRVLSALANPHGPIITPAAKAVRVGGHGFRAASYAINGVCDQAEKWVHALERATSRRDLRFLTLLPFRSVLPDHLFRHHRAWCALCFEQWRATRQVVYEPLVWGIKVATHCPVHHRPLDHVCPRCTRTLNPLGVFSRPGWCERCGGWLGLAETVDANPLQSAERNGEEQTWTCMQVGDLLSMLPEVNPALLRESFHQNLVGYLEQIADGNVRALAEYTRCPHCILQNWLDGATVPRLTNLLRTCRSLNVPVSSLFSPSGPTPTNIAAAKEAVARIGRRNVSPSRHASEIRRALVAAIRDDTPRSLPEIARSLGYTSPERLYQADRKLCRKLTARYRQSGRSHWWKKPGAARICEPDRIREILEQSLESTEPTSVNCIAERLGYSNAGYIQQKFPELCRAIYEKVARAKETHPETIRRFLEDALREDPAPTLADLSDRLGYTSSSVLRAHEPKLCDQLLQRRQAQSIQYRADLKSKAQAALRESPVPSARELCERLGITTWFMEQWFPDLKRAIAEQRRRCLSAEKARRREELLQTVRGIAAKLQYQGLYPSTNRIVEQLPEGSCRRWKILTWAIREVRNELGLST